jgi:putative pyridoxal-dependent aspartate 1-decarboxylase
LQDRWANIFSFSPEQAMASTHTERRVADILQRLLETGEVSGHSDLRSLEDRFRQSSYPERPISFESYLNYLEENIIPHAINLSSPRCIGHMTSAVPRFAMILAELVTGLNQNLVKNEASKAFTLIERQTIGMMHSLIYNYPSEFYSQHVQERDSTLGIMVSGSTLANVTALWIARNTALRSESPFAGANKGGVDFAHDGYRGAVIIGSALMHYSFEKAADVLGLSCCQIRRVSVDAAGRIKLDSLRETVGECLGAQQQIIAIVGIAGSTDCGSIDPLQDIAEIAAKAGAHFHVDAAWGAPLMFSRNYKARLAGIERADSVAVDGHKQMLLPLGCSMLLLRDPAAAQPIKQSARYMLQEHSSDLGKYSLEGSRPNAALYIHAALHVLGREGYELLIDNNMRKASMMVDAIRRRPEFELLVPPETNIILYRYIPKVSRERQKAGKLSTDDNARISVCNKQLQQAQFQAGRTYVSSTIADYTRAYGQLPIVALRAVLGNPRTREEDIGMVLDDQIKIAAELHI